MSTQGTSVVGFVHPEGVETRPEFWTGYEYARQHCPTDHTAAETSMLAWDMLATMISRHPDGFPSHGDPDGALAFCLGASACISIGLPASPAT